MKTKIRKVVFPVAGRGTRTLPASKAVPKEMLPVLDRPLIQHSFEEAVASGLEQFLFVTGRDKGAIEDHFDRHRDLELALAGKDEALAAIRDFVPPPADISFVRQQEPLGLGHAVWCGRHFSAGEPVAVVLTDDLVLGDKPCLAQLLDAQAEFGGNVIAVMEVPADQTSRYGVIDPGKGGGSGNIIPVTGLVEKPLPEDAPSNLAVVGRYVLQPEIFDELAKMEKGAGGEIQLTDGMAGLIGKMPFHAVIFEGRRFDCGSAAGLLEANLAYGLKDQAFAPGLRSVIEEFL